MKLFKQKTTTPSRRQRQDHAPGMPANFSYHSRRSSDGSGNTGRDKAREALRPSARRFGNFWVQRFGLLTLLIVAVACLVSMVSLSQKPKIVALRTVEGAELLQPTEVYQSAADKLFQSSILNRTKLTINTGKISRQLAEQFPELSSATITLPLLAHRPIVYLEPVQPALVLSTTNGSYIVDTTGKALLPSIGLLAASNGSLPNVIDQSGLKVEVNKRVLPGNDVAFIRTVSAQLAARQIAVASLTLPAGSQQLDVRLSNKPFFIKFNLADYKSARLQAGSFLAVNASLERQGITPTEYIDVRVIGRAYYK
jgi:hypothetical protein